ncbi:MAG: cytochrome c oxidase accessory protein CcoG [Gammaproteobacteria bacterium]|nr:cytochrome c oxidase accessory protein CcoG [Gammaproteobacteria bacterium]MBU1624742.1 cytochrome c oxidase accessory protein CcoG [Gammaproteobacteria bacterium]MBU1982586.1 cytochrome c oxidase accessory protein CcoG [Gammaproteobacteria bacterium]
MNQEMGKKEPGEVTTLYNEFETWTVNTGGQTIHAKRMPGFFRTFKDRAQLALWLPFFLLPYLRWNGKQAILFDVDHNQFHFFSLTVLPQDIWMLSLVLLVAAMTLFAVTSVASRVWCGYFCFQTAWTDWYTWLEEKIEGNPTARRKLDAAPWTLDKIKKKVIKHLLWMLIALLTGISFSIWFVDAFEYWNKLLHFQLPLVGWVTLTMFLFGTYILAGFLREQTCFWLCPYARIQGVMSDSQTILPTYDYTRGEPRGKIRKGGEAVAPQGDCIDCFQCVQVCPTGVDIRNGQQLGCITCGLCIDACDVVMDKINKPRGLIRYASLDELSGQAAKKIYQHPRTLVYLSIILLALSGIVWGLTHMGSMTLKIVHERQPLFVQMSDGSIQNKFDFKVLNKTDKDFRVKVSAEGGVKDQVIIGAEQDPMTHHGRGTSFTIFVKAPAVNIKKDVVPIQFRVENVDDPNVFAEYTSKFYGPNK